MFFVFSDAVRTKLSYSSEPLDPGISEADDGDGPHLEPLWTNGVNVNLGTARLRQLRVAQRAECKPARPLMSAVSDCIPGVTGSDASLARGIEALKRGGHFTMSSGEQVGFRKSTDGFSWTSPHTHVTYPSGGFVEDLPTNNSFAQDRLQFLRDHGWVCHSSSVSSHPCPRFPLSHLEEHH